MTSDVLERVWPALSRWAVPVMMALAYAFLAATSETDTAGKAWMAVGLGLVLVVWFVFRALTETAALARALRVGDTTRLFALADRHLPRTRRPADRARFLVARAFAHALRGEPAEALAVIGEARPDPELQPLASAVTIGALVELGRAAEARALVITAPGAPALGWLAEGRCSRGSSTTCAPAARPARSPTSMRPGSPTRAARRRRRLAIAPQRRASRRRTRHGCAGRGPQRQRRRSRSRERRAQRTDARADEAGHADHGADVTERGPASIPVMPRGRGACAAPRPRGAAQRRRAPR
jgi:hypothetical protein